MKLHQLIKAALFTPGEGGFWGLPILLWGPPGAVKTASVEAVARQYGLPCEVLAPGERGEGAFGVVPCPDKNWIMRYPKPDWVLQFDATGGRGLVFCDEVTTAPPAVKPGIMGITLARRIGTHQFPHGVRVLGAANPPELCAGYDLSPAEANRFGHINWEGASLQEHLDHMADDDGLRPPGSGGAPVTIDACIREEERVVAAWPEHWAYARSMEAGFLSAQPTLKHRMPKPDAPDLTRAWPSDRTWKMATRALASSRVHGLDPQTTEQFVAGFIGEGAACELFQFIQHVDLPDARAWLEGRDTFIPSARRLDRTIAALTGATLVAQESETLSVALVTLLRKLLEDGVPGDVVLPALSKTLERSQAARTSITKGANRAILDPLNEFVALQAKYRAAL